LKTPAFPVPKVNYCDVTSLLRSLPFISDMIVLVEKYANSTGFTRCPMVIGDYHMANMHVNDSAIKELFWLKRNARYMLQFTLQDENDKKTQLIHDVKYFVAVKPK
jgi:hypothetical protein